MGISEAAEHSARPEEGIGGTKQTAILHTGGGSTPNILSHIFKSADFLGQIFLSALLVPKEFFVVQCHGGGGVRRPPPSWTSGQHSTQLRDACSPSAGDFASDVNPEVLREHIAPLIRVLLQRTGDMNSRICSAAVDFLMYLAALPLVGISHISEYLTEPIENALAFKHVIARLNLLLTVIGQYGFADDGGLSPEVCRVLALEGFEWFFF